MVIEVMGGHDVAKDIVLSAAKKGQHVITANKALLAASLPLIEEAFPKRHARNYRNIKTGERGQGPTLGYEAAVCGSIPIIRTLQTSLLCDNIYSIKGIMNGTTNYILSRMRQDSLSYSEALKGAQAVGFAEADPTADVEGHDARNKLILLTKLAYGVYIPPEKVPCQGITTVTDLDFEIAKELGYTIKLLGVSKSELIDTTTTTNNNKDTKPKRVLDMYVSPTLVREDSPLASTHDGLNQVIVESESIGTSTYYGPGAGRYPTANSVVADMMNIAMGTMILPPFPRPATTDRLKISNDIPRWWYLRAPTDIMNKLTSKLWYDILEINTTGRYHSRGYDALLVTDRSAKDMQRLVNLANQSLASSSNTNTSINTNELKNPIALFPVDDEFVPEEIPEEK